MQCLVKPENQRKSWDIILLVIKLTWPSVLAYALHAAELTAEKLHDRAIFRMHEALHSFILIPIYIYIYMNVYVCV